MTFTAGPTSSRHIYTITDPDGLTDSAELAVLVVPNRAPLVEPFTVQTPADETDHRRPRPARPPIPTATRCSSPAARTPRAARPRRSTNGAGALTVAFDPDDGFAGPATFSYTVDDQQGHTVAGAVTIDVLPPSNRPPTATDATLPVEAGITTNIDLSALVTDPDADDTLTYAITGPAEGVAQLAQDGSNVAATAAIDQGTRTDSFQYTRHGQRRAVGHGDGGAGHHGPIGPAAPGPGRRGDDEPGPGRDGGRARQRHRPARRRPHGHVGRRVRRAGSDVDRRPAGDVHAGRRRSSARRRSSTASATARTSAPASPRPRSRSR